MSGIEWIGSLNTVHRSRGLSAMCVCNSRLIWQEKITIENSLTQRDAIVVHLLHILAGLSFFFFWLHKSVKSPCRHQGFDLKTSWQVRFNYASFCMSSIPRNEIITQLGSTSTELMLFQYTAHRPLMSLYLLPYLSRSIFSSQLSTQMAPCRAITPGCHANLKSSGSNITLTPKTFQSFSKFCFRNAWLLMKTAACLNKKSSQIKWIKSLETEPRLQRGRNFNHRANIADMKLF